MFSNFIIHIRVVSNRPKLLHYNWPFGELQGLLHPNLQRNDHNECCYLLVTHRRRVINKCFPDNFLFKNLNFSLFDRLILHHSKKHYLCTTAAIIISMLSGNRAKLGKNPWLPTDCWQTLKQYELNLNPWQPHRWKALGSLMPVLQVVKIRVDNILNGDLKAMT